LQWQPKPLIELLEKLTITTTFTWRSLTQTKSIFIWAESTRTNFKELVLKLKENCTIRWGAFAISCGPLLIPYADQLKKKMRSCHPFDLIDWDVLANQSLFSRLYACVTGHDAVSLKRTAADPFK
jgi:hypothetical protein